jgi:hypothetical protein
MVIVAPQPLILHKVAETVWSSVSDTGSETEYLTLPSPGDCTCPQVALFGNQDLRVDE